MTQSELIAQMTPRLKEKYLVYEALMAEAGIRYRLNEVLRTKIRQLAYACQGRTYDELITLLTKSGWIKSLQRVVDLRSQGWTIQQTCDIFRTESGIHMLHGKEWYKVTKTLNSKHFALPDGLAGAFDIKLLKDNDEPTWDTKWDNDKDGIPEYLEAARLGKKAGLDAGGLWPWPDYPHYSLGG